MTVKVDGSANPVVGIFNDAGSSTELLHVAVLVEGTGPYGVINHGDNARMEHVRVAVGGGGLNVGVHNTADGIVLEDVEIVATSTGAGEVYGLVNAGVVDATIRGVRVEASGGSSRRGVYNVNGSSLSLRDLTVRVSASATLGYGVFNLSSTVILEDCSITADGGSHAVAVEYLDASGAITDCTLQATGASSDNVGLFLQAGSSGPYAVDVERSRVRGATSSIDGVAAYTVRVGVSQLDGPVAVGPAYTCVHSYDGSFAPVTCPP